MWGVIKSVLAALLGVQKEKQRREDFEKGNPMAFVLVGIIIALLFVGLIALVAIWAAG